VPTVPEEAGFRVSDGVAAVAVRGGLFWRLDGLLGWRGDLRPTPEVKRFRGRATGQPFGAGPERVHHVAGQGTLLLAVDGRRLSEVPLDAEGAFFRESVVLGFDATVAFENGRLTSVDGDVELVHLRGAGHVALRTAGPLVALEAAPGSPVRVSATALVGWLGGLTPRLVAEPDGLLAGTAVELMGEGRVLVDGGAPGGATT
jgi:hypothetical protein